jgi:hypothetical protein
LIERQVRHTDGETDICRYRQMDRQKGRKAESWIDKKTETERWTDRRVDKQKVGLMERQTSGHTDRWTDRKEEREKVRQMGRHRLTDGQTDRWTDTNGQDTHGLVEK